MNWNKPRIETIMKICPHCYKAYAPKFPDKTAAREAHLILGTGTLMDVEQWISGMCSQKCWDELFPPEDEG